MFGDMASRKVDDQKAKPEAISDTTRFAYLRGLAAVPKSAWLELAQTKTGAFFLNTMARRVRNLKD